jgi:DNA-directed RNA polymerase specialized sigma24 family protein
MGIILEFARWWKFSPELTGCSMARHEPGRTGAIEFGYLFLLSYRQLHRAALRLLHDDEEARQAIQNCFFVARRMPHPFEDATAFRRWLVGVLIRESLTIRRRLNEEKDVSGRAGCR